MFKYIISIAFAIVSVSDIFSAGNTCDVLFYKLKDAVNGVFAINRSEQVIGFKLILDSDVLEANSGHVIEFLKSKIKEKSYNEPIKLYCLEGSSNGFFCNGLGKQNSLNKELTDEALITHHVKAFINEEVGINGSIKVYFYATQKPKDSTKDSKNGKCCCC